MLSSSLPVKSLTVNIEFNPLRGPLSWPLAVCERETLDQQELHTLIPDKSVVKVKTWASGNYIYFLLPALM